MLGNGLKAILQCGMVADIARIIIQPNVVFKCRKKSIQGPQMGCYYPMKYEAILKAGMTHRV